MACNPLWDQTVLALKFDGTNGSTTITDEKGHTVTCYGNAQLTTTNPCFGTACLTLDGSGDYLGIPPIASELSLTGDFTIRFRHYCNDNTNSYPSIVATQGGWSSGAFTIQFDHMAHASKFSVHWNGATPSDPFIASSSTFSFNQWREVEFVRAGSTCTLRVDGVSQGTGTCALTLNLAYGGELRIGRGTWDGAAGYALGQIDALEVINGAAAHTADYTPASSVFLTNQCAISGTAMNASSVLTDRLIRVHLRDSGALVGQAISNATTGVYSITTTYDGEHTVTCLDSNSNPPSGGTENALIFDRVLPA